MYAAREKNGIYIPRDRYLQEEAEKKVSITFVMIHLYGKIYSSGNIVFIYTFSPHMVQAMAEKFEKMELESESKDKVIIIVNIDLVPSFCYCQSLFVSFFVNSVYFFRKSSTQQSSSNFTTLRNC